MQHVRLSWIRRPWSVAGFLGMLFMVPRPVVAAPYAYVTRADQNAVSVIDLATGGVVATIAVGGEPRGATAGSAGSPSTW